MGRNLKAVRLRKRSSLDERRARVAKLYHQGVMLKDIASTVKVSVLTVQKDLAALHAQWLEDGKAMYAQRQVGELQRLDALEAEAAEAWAKSKEISITEMDETSVGGKDGEKTISRTTRRHQVGDPRFLVEMRSCIEQRCKILGLYPKESKGENGEPGGTQAGPAELRKILAEMTNEELEAMSAPHRKYRELLTRRFGGLN